MRRTSVFEPWHPCTSAPVNAHNQSPHQTPPNCMQFAHEKISRSFEMETAFRLVLPQEVLT
jgi:hypothetical protein